MIHQQLRKAAWAGEPDLVDKLLRLGADPARANLCGRCALHLSALGGHAEACILIAERRPELLNHPDCHGMTPLHLAALSGSYSAVEELLKLGCDPAAQANGLYPKDCAKTHFQRILLSGALCCGNLEDLASRCVSMISFSGSAHPPTLL